MRCRKSHVEDPLVYYVWRKRSPSYRQGRGNHTRDHTLAARRRGLADTHWLRGSGTGPGSGFGIKTFAWDAC